MDDYEFTVVFYLVPDTPGYNAPGYKKQPPIGDLMEEMAADNWEQIFQSANRWHLMVTYRRLKKTA